ncbi:MAG TPA: glycosyltransferase family 4 protein [Paludibacter sp.]|nr:glycosyltransferase family 4 protein [Paludibacter sp.]
MIVIVSGIVPPEHSGAGKRIFSFYKYLATQGYEVTLVTHTRNKDDSVIVIKMHDTCIFRRFNHLLTFIKSTIQLIAIFSTKKIQNKNMKTAWLVSCGPLTFAAAIVFYILGYRIITQNTLIGSDDPEFKYPCDCMGLKYTLKRLQYHLSDVVTSISPALYNISKHYHSNCVMIPNPVSSKFRVKHRFPNEALNRNNVLFVGKMNHRKGFDIVIRTINLLHKEDPQIRFTFVGCKDDNDKSELLFRILPFINSDKITFVGFQVDPEQWFAEADIFFMPSRREGFGTVFIEAMASGLPVIAKKLDQITDYIFGNDYPTILDTEDPKSYANAIMSLLNNKDLYEKLSKEGIKLVERFDQNKIFQQYINILGDSRKHIVM